MENTKTDLHVRVIDRLKEEAHHAYESDDGPRCARLLRIGSQIEAIIQRSIPLNSRFALRLIQQSNLSYDEKMMLLSDIQSTLPGKASWLSAA